MQLDHYSSKFIPREFPIILVSDNISNAPNLGSLFRTSDAFGIQKLILCGEQIHLGRKMAKTSRATEKVVPYELSASAFETIQTLKQQGYYIISLEITEQSSPVHTISFNQDQPIALVIGDENFGIDDRILNTSDAIIHIEMFGRNSSMNVVQAANIALYEITKQLM